MNLVHFHTISKIKLSKLCKEFCKENFNIKLVFNSFKIKNYFAYKDPVPNDLKFFLVYKVVATFARLVVILKLGLTTISKRIASLTLLNIYTLSKNVSTHIILFVLKLLIRLTLNST